MIRWQHLTLAGGVSRCLPRLRRLFRAPTDQRAQSCTGWRREPVPGKRDSGAHSQRATCLPGCSSALTPKSKRTEGKCVCGGEQEDTRWKTQGSGGWIQGGQWGAMVLPWAGLGPNTCGEGSGGGVVLAADEKRRPGIRPAHPPRAGEASAGRESCSGAKSSPKMWGEPRSSTKGGRPMCGRGGSQFPVWVSTSGQRQAGGERRDGGGSGANAAWKRGGGAAGSGRPGRAAAEAAVRTPLGSGAAAQQAPEGPAGPGGGGVRCRS